MITLNYSKDDMIRLLTRVGYEVKKETDVKYYGYNGNEQPIELAVYNCYYKGTRMDMFDWLYGLERLEKVFEQEFRKRAESIF